MTGFPRGPPQKRPRLGIRAPPAISSLGFALLGCGLSLKDGGNRVKKVPVFPYRAGNHMPCLHVHLPLCLLPPCGGLSQTLCPSMIWFPAPHPPRPQDENPSPEIETNLPRTCCVVEQLPVSRNSISYFRGRAEPDKPYPRSSCSRRDLGKPGARKVNHEIRTMFLYNICAEAVRQKSVI